MSAFSDLLAKRTGHASATYSTNALAANAAASTFYAALVAAMPSGIATTLTNLPPILEDRITALMQEFTSHALK